MLLNEIINEVGMTKRAVKYYEEKGLLSVDKDSNGYRMDTIRDSIETRANDVLKRDKNRESR